MKWINECKQWGLALIFFLSGAASFGQSFTEVGAIRNAQVGTGSKDGGQAWADLNQDGFLDLLVNTNNNTSYSRLLFWNSGTNQYDDVTATHAPDLLSNVCERSALTGDFDNDGDIDFMRSSFQRLEIYENLGSGAATPYSFSLKQVVTPAFFTGPGTQGGMNNEGLAWMDFDGDGDLDVYMEDHQYGQDILENDGTGVFTHYTPDSDPKGFPTTGISGDYSVTADLDNNGDVDIVARREGTANALRDIDIFTNNSDGTFSPNSTLNLETRNSFKGGVAVADFDSDGDFDYFWTNHGTSSGNVTHVIAEQTGLNSGSFTLASVTISPAPSWTGLEIEGIAMGDVNNDGKVDIFLASDSGTGYLLVNTTAGGTFSFSHSNAGINLGADGEGAAFGDYDNDGDLDLYVNIWNGNNQLWENDLGGNTDYLKVEPLINLGGGLSRSATGATVVMELRGCTNLKFIQEVSGGVGHGSQNDPRLHFGLPSGPNTQYKMTVSFVRPNGGGRTIVEKYVTPSALANQTIQILDTDVSDPNAHPNAVDDGFGVPSNSTNNSLDVLNNDSDPNAEDLTISLLSGVTTQGGIISVNVNGTPADPTDDFVEYTPPAAFSGVDNFTYHITNQSGFCSSADVTITVNAPPTADNNTVTTDEDIAYTFSTADFTVNYSDPDGDAFAEIQITSLESVGNLLYNGSAVILNQVITTADLAGGLLTFESLPDENGTPYDSFNFTVGDGSLFSPVNYTLTINVDPVDDLPISNDKTIDTPEDTPYVFSVSDFNFSRIRITRLESVGELLLNGNPVVLNQIITIVQIAGNQLTFVPLPNQNGSPYDDFDFEVGDNFNFNPTDYTVTINVLSVNDPPSSSNISLTIDEDINQPIDPTVFTGGYSDPEGDPLVEIRITSLPTTGTLYYNGNPVTIGQVIPLADIVAGQVTFEPLPNENGMAYDSFDFEVGDGTSFSTSSSTFTINVTPVNDIPLAVDDNTATPEDVPISVDVLANDNPGDPPTRISAIDGVTTQGGSAVINNNGTPADNSDDFIDYSPLVGFSGLDTFTYTIEDLDGETSTATVSIDVTPVINNPPTSTDVNFTIDEDINRPIDPAIFTAGYSDPEGDPLVEIRITSLPTSGTLYYNGSPVTIGQVIPLADIVGGLVTFEPLPDENGVAYASFEFEVGDGNSFSTASNTFTINVNAVNDVPLAVDDNTATPEDITVAVDVLGNDNLGDESTRIDAVDAISTGGGSAVINNNGTPADNSDDFIEYTPAMGYSGFDSFTYTIEDNDGETSTATVTVEVTQAPAALTIYKGFSPNGDGSNDQWVIDGILLYPGNSVQVFNRWGNLVYKETGYDNQTKVWFGQSNEGLIVGDNILPDGTYFYMVDLGDGSDLHSGYVMLKR